MDPEGRGLTNAGKIIGMIGTILYGVSILACCGIWLFGIIFAGAQH
jgi:hypothetical protein